MTTEPFEPVAPEPDSLPEPVAAPSQAAQSARSSRLLVNAVMAVAFAVLVGSLGFVAGRATAPVAGAPNPRSNPSLQGGNGVPGGNDPGAQDGTGRFPGGFGGDDGVGRRGALGGSVEGTVVSMSSTALTIQLAGGQTVDIAVDSGTGYHRQAGATAADVTTGSTVIVTLGGIASTGQGSGPTASSITVVP